LVEKGLLKMVLSLFNPKGCPIIPNNVDLHVAFCPAITVTFFPKGIVNFFIALNRSTYKDFIIFMYPLLSVLIL
jgi:hypothetical protein